MKIKRIISAALCVMTLVFAMASCNTTPKSDIEYIKEKGTLVVGMTDFKPMDYKDTDGNWIGFDADMATKFAETLGVEIKFVEITWANKAMDLQTKTIDIVWNGMTLTNDVKNSMGTSEPYCMNAQVVVMKKDLVSQYTTTDSLKELSFAVEDGSAGAKALDALGIEAVALDTQAKALMEVASGTSQACVIDLLMAGAMIGEGTSYPDLAIGIELESEEYGVGFRKNSDLIEEFNKFWKKQYDDGFVTVIAEKYGIAQNIIAK